jgi:exonuclease VII small subunit
MANVNNIVKRLEEGTATYEDVMEMVNAGVDIEKF